MLVADTGNDRVEEFSDEGEYLGQLGSPGSGPGELDGPGGVAIGSGGEALDPRQRQRPRRGVQRERRIPTANRVQGLTRRRAANGPEGVAIDTDGHVWVLDTRNSRVEEFGETGDFIPKSGTCTNLAAATGASYAPGWEDVGSKLRAHVTASNSAGEASASAETEAVEEGGDLLGALILPSISGSAQAGQMLTANPGSWIGSEPISYAYQWQSCDWMGVDCEEIPGATGATPTLREDELGKTVYVVVTATNALGSSSASSEPSAVVRGAPPSNTAPPAISGTAQQGQTLSASTGSWTGSPAPSFSYQWKRCNRRWRSLRAYRRRNKRDISGRPGRRRDKDSRKRHRYQPRGLGDGELASHRSRHKHLRGGHPSKHLGADHHRHHARRTGPEREPRSLERNRTPFLRLPVAEPATKRPANVRTSKAPPISQSTTLSPTGRGTTECGS